MSLREKRRCWVPLSLCLVVTATVAMTAASGPPGEGPKAHRPGGHGPGHPPNHGPGHLPDHGFDRPPDNHHGGGRGPRHRPIVEGLQTFRYDTFGDEEFWGGTLGLHETVATLSPAQVLDLGLKVDSEALSPHFKQELRRGKIDLTDPSVTLELLRMNAVVGVTGFFSRNGRRLESIGIQCALCHSVVDDSLASGIGRRRDGWANRDLNVGAIVAAAPSVKPFAAALGTDEATVRTVLGSWGPGKFDAELILDGKAFRPDGKTGATLIPPAFGMAGIDLATWTGWGTVTYWNAFVANLEMHGQGNFQDPRLQNPIQFPVAVANGFFDVRSPIDRITPKLDDLREYQFSLKAPAPPPGSFNQAAAARGRRLFNGKGQCATCHVPPYFTEPGFNLHLPAEIGIDDFQANRSPTFRYRTTPLRGLWTHGKGGYYHDGRFENLADVIHHYDDFFQLGLSPREIRDLTEYLKSL